MISISGLVDSVQKGTVDFYGQRLCTILIYTIPTLGAILGVVVGYQRQDFKATLEVIASATVLCGAICIPAWPMYAKRQIKWKAVKEGN